jgi:hypothetical protein
MSLMHLVGTARTTVESALKAAVSSNADDGRALARDAKVINALAGAITRLEEARVAIFEYDSST